MTDQPKKRGRPRSKSTGVTVTENLSILNERPRRKVAIEKSTIDESDDDMADDGKQSKTTRNARMKHEEEEIYLAMCVEHFDSINDTSTIRGIPGSAAVKEREKKERDAWDAITNQMNEKNNVSSLRI